MGINDECMRNCWKSQNPSRFELQREKKCGTKKIERIFYDFSNGIIK